MDEIRALYGPANDDIDPPVLKRFSPADGAEITENTPTITVYAEDAGYDPVAHPGTTLIDPDKIRFYLDGSLVQHTLYPPEGKFITRRMFHSPMAFIRQKLPSAICRATKRPRNGTSP